MASVLTVLLPYLLLFYVLDSIRLVRKNHLLFFSHSGRRFRVRTSGFCLPGISPVGHIVYSHCNPVCCFSGGISHCNENCSARTLVGNTTHAVLSFESIGSITADHTSIRVNGEVWFKLPTNRSASHFVQTVRLMKGISEEERGGRMTGSMRRIFHVGQLQTLRKLYGKLFLPAQLLSTLLFGLLFILLPLSLFTGLSAHVHLGGLVSGIVFVYLLTLVFTYHAFRKVYRPSRWRGFLFALMLVGSPMSAVHPLNHLTADLYHRFDYLAIAAVLSEKKQFSALAEAELRKIRYVFRKSGPAALREFWALRETEILRLVKQAGIEVHELMSAPPRQDPAAVGFCPVCLTEYREGFAACSDCGIALHEFKT